MAISALMMAVQHGIRFSLQTLPTKVNAVADKNAGLVKIDRKSVEWHRGLIAIPVLEVNSRGVDGLENR